MALTLREKGALHRIVKMKKSGFSLKKIKQKLEPRYTGSERKKALEIYLFDLKK